MMDYGKIRDRRKAVMLNLPRASSLEDAELYFRSMAGYLDQLRTLLRELRREIR